LARHFHEIEIVKEKDEAQYRALLAARQLTGEESWMVGNSPKSDILAPLSAGYGAVYVPHRHTWHLELQHLPESHPRLLRMESFAALKNRF
jgi:putative hydrolase of the HAD superfamily